MGRGPAFSDDERAEILHCAIDLQMSTVAIANQIGRGREAVAKIVHEYAPTSKAAFAHFRAKALQMATHVVEKGTPADHITVLRDPKLGVLTPKDTSGESGGSKVAIFIGMGPGHAAMLPPSAQQLREADGEHEKDR